MQVLELDLVFMPLSINHLYGFKEIGLQYKHTVFL